jgi:hypothetical protein
MTGGGIRPPRVAPGGLQKVLRKAPTLLPKEPDLEIFFLSDLF